MSFLDTCAGLSENKKKEYHKSEVSVQNLERLRSDCANCGKVSYNAWDFWKSVIRIYERIQHMADETFKVFRRPFGEQAASNQAWMFRSFTEHVFVFSLIRSGDVFIHVLGFAFKGQKTSCWKFSIVFATENAWETCRMRGEKRERIVLQRQFSFVKSVN